MPCAAEHDLKLLLNLKNKKMPKNETWISIDERLPKETGWYKVKTTLYNREYEVPLYKDLSGKLIWVVPDQKMITHWKKERDEQ